MKKHILIERAVAWLHEQVDAVDFGEVGICLIIHDRQIRRIEKTIIEKEKSE